MTCATCPNCGIDLAKFDRFSLGPLDIVGNSAVYWRGYRVPLSVAERLLVIALARANGAVIPAHVLADVVDYEGPGPSKLLDVHISHIRRKFLDVDPNFNQIERGGKGEASHRGARWRAEAYVLPELRAITANQRAVHKLMLAQPGCSLDEWAAMRGRGRSALYQAIRALERRMLVKRASTYQRGWTAVGALSMHAEIEAGNVPTDNRK